MQYRSEQTSICRTPIRPRGTSPSAAFLRPVKGYNNINIREAAGSSNYHSLQLTVNPAFQRGLQFGASWTWSKAMDFNDEDGQTSAHWCR